MNLIYPDNKLNESQINQWRTNGYLLIDNVLEDNIFKNALEQFNELFPNIDDINKVNGKL